MTVIPQSPVLFNQTIRLNLDPTGEHGDEEIWKALEQSQMKGTIKELQGGLEFMVEEGESV